MNPGFPQPIPERGEKRTSNMDGKELEEEE